MDLLGEKNVEHNFYADDSPFIFNCTEDKEQVGSIISSVVHRFEHLKLKINVTKTDIIRHKNPFPTEIRMLLTNIGKYTSVKLIGFHLDEITEQRLAKCTALSVSVVEKVVRNKNLANFEQKEKFSR